MEKKISQNGGRERDLWFTELGLGDVAVMGGCCHAALSLLTCYRSISIGPSSVSSVAR